MSRNRTTAVIATVACAAGGAAAVGATNAGATRPATAASGLKLSLAKTKLGEILVQNGGLVVYDFTHDRRNTNTCPKSNGCASVWPPLLSAGKPALGPGVKASLVGLIKYGSGTKEQVTYAGHPLYNYITNGTSTSYVGYVQFGGHWDALTASGAQKQ